MSSAAINSGWIIALACSAALVVLHGVFATHAGPLWRDEAADISFATMPSWTEIWRHLHLDNFPPLLLVALRIWTSMGLGGTDAGYRVWGCLVGSGLIAILWIVARLGGQRTPLLGLVLFGLTPYTLWFGDAIRPYGLGIGIMILTFGLVWRLANTGSFLYFVLAAIAAIVSVQALYQNAALILAIGTAGAVVCMRRGQMRRASLVLGTGALAAVSLFPYVPLIQKANEWSFVSRTGLGWERLVTMVTQALSAAGMFSVMVWGVLVCGGLVYAAARNVPHRSKNVLPEDSDLTLYAGLTVLLSICLFVILLRYVGMPTQPWYYLAPMALAAVALDMIFFVSFRRSRPAAMWLIIAVATATAITSMPSTWEMAHIRQSNVDQIAARLETLAEQGDLIVVDPWAYGITFQRYFHKPVEWLTVPLMADHRIHRYDLLKQQMESRDPLGPLMSRMTDTLKSGHRIWVVGNIEVPPDNESPLVLPPAPNSPVGWSEGDYQLSWSRQIGYFFRLHAQRGQLIDIPITQAINPFENANLVRVDSWQEKPPAR